MTEERKAENGATQEGALVNRDTNNKTITSLKKRVKELEGVISVLEEDKDSLGEEVVNLDKELKTEKALRAKAERTLNDGKPLESGRSYEDMKKETFEERITRKWGQSPRIGN